MKKIFALFVLISIALMGCDKFAQTEKVWKVKAGENFCTEYPLPAKATNGSKFCDFVFHTNETWIWPDGLSTGGHDNGWSKVRGFSEGHHINGSSARLVYRYVNGHPIAGLGVNRDGEWDAVIIDTLEIPGRYWCRISREGDWYVMRMNGREVRLPAGKEHIQGYYLRPYVGGNYTLDHDWLLLIEDKF